MTNYKFDELRKKLDKESWPAIYMFKFIVASENHSIALIESFFEDDAEIKMHSSTNGKYTSITIRQVMLNAKSIIKIYEKAANIEGIISL